MQIAIVLRFYFTSGRMTDIKETLTERSLWASLVYIGSSRVVRVLKWDFTNSEKQKQNKTKKKKCQQRQVSPGEIKLVQPLEKSVCRFPKKLKLEKWPMLLPWGEIPRILSQQAMEMLAHLCRNSQDQTTLDVHQQRLWYQSWSGAWMAQKRVLVMVAKDPGSAACPHNHVAHNHL